jgi:hypothetical protein
MDEPVAVTTVRDKFAADMVCDLLRSAGLECGFRPTAASVMSPILRAHSAGDARDGRVTRGGSAMSLIDLSATRQIDGISPARCVDVAGQLTGRLGARLQGPRIVPQREVGRWR